jgi:hypothetical protein
MNQNNSAYRLCTILDKAMKVGDEQKDATAAIGIAMGIKDISDRRFMTDFFVIIADTERSILLLKNLSRKESFIEIIRQIQNLFFSHNLREHWPNIKNAINGGNLTLLLASCADFIAREIPAQNLSENQLKDYLLECEELVRKVSESDLSEDIKTFLVMRLEEICIAIRHYSIGGSERLRAVVEANIGGILPIIPTLHEKDRSSPILKIFIATCMSISAAIGTAANIKTLAPDGYFEKLLLNPAPLVQDIGVAQITSSQ